MFSSIVEPNPPCEVLEHGDHLATLLQDFSPDQGAPAIDVRSLAPRTELVVKTRNSRYHLIMCHGGSRALVQGGHDFRQEVEAHIAGSVVGGSCLKVGWIAVGLSLEIAIGTRRVVTSRVCSIDIMSRPTELG